MCIHHFVGAKTEKPQRLTARATFSNRRHDWKSSLSRSKGFGKGTASAVPLAVKGSSRFSA
jgi:hypothetical protein